MSNILACYQLLELNVISAQDLAPVGRSMRTYAVAWIDPDRKLSTRVDSEGGTNPTWNDKFVFRIDEDFLYDDTSTITIDIYALHWFRDIHVGTAHVLAEDIIPPQSSRPFHTQPELRRTKSDTSSMIGSEVMAHEKRAKAKKGKASSVVTPSEVSTRSQKKTSSMLSGSEVKATPRKEHSVRAGAYNRGGVRATPLHAYAMRNAAMEYGTPYRSNLGHHTGMTDSELGPSASEVAAVVARKPVVEEGENSTVGGWSLDDSVEGLQPKIERWKAELPTVYDGGEMSSLPAPPSSKKGKHSRRHTEGGGMACSLALVLFVVLNAPLFVVVTARRTGAAGLSRWTMKAFYEKRIACMAG
ncbi:C2 domain [Sesbania bispinosa]|nr:C2 domain [Sesbania bispinosa]